MSDFHQTLATVHSGSCPFCAGKLSLIAETDPPWERRAPQWLIDAKDMAVCFDCKLGMAIAGAHDPAPSGTSVGLAPRIDFSRDLTPDERRRLYVRS